MVNNTGPAAPLYSCYTDGASRGNPGPSSWAFIVVQHETLIHEESGFIGYSTNNRAEYMAVIHCLQWLSGITRGPVKVFSDSELVVRQLSGNYAVRNAHLKVLYDEIQVLTRTFSDVNYQSLPRENHFIIHVDFLCNQVLDELG